MVIAATDPQGLPIRDRASQGKYDKQLLDVIMHAGGGGSSTYDKFLALAFGGSFSVVKDLAGTAPRL